MTRMLTRYLRKLQKIEFHEHEFLLAENVFIPCVFVFGSAEKFAGVGAGPGVGTGVGVRTMVLSSDGLNAE